MAGMVSQPISARDAALRRAHEFAKAQGGVFRSQQLQEEFGISRRVIRSQVGAGVWVRHGRSVLALPGLPDGLRERSLIVAHRLSGAACLTGPSVLAVRGLLRAPPWDALPETMEPWVIYPYRVVIPARVLQRRDDGGATMLGVRIAQPHTVMLDLLRFLPESDARNLTYRASGTSEWAGFMRGLATTAADYQRMPGAVQLRAMAALVATGARSEAELLAQQLLNAAGLTEWRANYPVRVRGQRYVIDIAFPGALVAVEIDGRAFHGDARFNADRKRHNALEGAGWRVLHFTWDRLVHEPEGVVREIRQALALAGAAS